MKIVAIIPARYSSTRLPRKPLVDILGQTMIQRVCKQCEASQLFNKIVVATDHKLIANHVKDIGFKAILTRKTHPSGTERCAEALQQLDSSFTHVVNVQGDEPFVKQEQLKIICKLLAKNKIVTLVKKIKTIEELKSKNTVKVVVNKHDEALYFSRLPIPYNAKQLTDLSIIKSAYLKHIGIYGFKRSTLVALSKIKSPKMEILEKLEQLKWVYHGYKIKTGLSNSNSISIDTQEDLDKAIKLFHNYA